MDWELMIWYPRCESFCRSLAKVYTTLQWCQRLGPANTTWLVVHTNSSLRLHSEKIPTPRKFPRHSEKNLRPLRGNSHAIPRKFPYHSKEILTPFRDNFHAIPRKFQRHSEKIPRLFQEFPRRSGLASGLILLKVSTYISTFFRS